MLKNDIMISCQAPGCTNRGGQNSNVTTSVVIIIMLFWLYCSIFRTLAQILDDEAYWEPWHDQNNLFRHFQGHSAILSHVQAN